MIPDTRDYIDEPQYIGLNKDHTRNLRKRKLRRNERKKIMKRK